VIGGAVPWLLLGNEDMPHVGTLDVDLGLDAEALGDGEYATLVAALMGHGYQQREELRRFQLVRQVPATDGGPIDVIVDFLMPRDAEIRNNVPPLIDEFAVQRADGADLAVRFYQMVAIAGPMPAGGTNRVEIAVCSIPALLAMKGHATVGRYKQKDASTSIIASGTIQAAPMRLPGRVARCSIMPVVRRAISSSRRSSTRRMAMDRFVSGGLSKAPGFSAIARQTNGSWMPLARSTLGCGLLD
jgi:hypothetical protein